MKVEGRIILARKRYSTDLIELVGLSSETREPKLREGDDKGKTRPAVGARRWRLT